MNVSARAVFAAWVGLGAIWLAPTASANSPVDYAYTFPIETPPGIGSSAWRIELTPAVYAWVHDPGLGDIEVFNAAGQPVPLTLRAPAAAAVTTERRRAIAVLALPHEDARSGSGDLHLIIDRDETGRLRRVDAGERGSTRTQAGERDWLLDVGAASAPLDRIVLAWSAPQSGIVARFSIEASDDLQAWRPLGQASVLSLQQDGARIERRDIALGNVHAAYLRLHRVDDGEALRDLAAEAVSIDVTATAAPRAWIVATPVVDLDRADERADAARFEYRLPAALPADSARIVLAGDNAVAALTLSSRTSPAGAWQERARLTAFRLDARRATNLEAAAIEPVRNGDAALVDAARALSFRITSRAPVYGVPKLSIGYHPDSLVFLAQGAGPYTLAVGSLRARRADYPVDVALANLRAQLGKDWLPPDAAIGSAQVSAGAVALQAPAPARPWRRWLLWGILVAGAALVAVFALNLLRDARLSANDEQARDGEKNDTEPR